MKLSFKLIACFICVSVFVACVRKAERQPVIGSMRYEHLEALFANEDTMFLQMDSLYAHNDKDGMKHLLSEWNAYMGPNTSEQMNVNDTIKAIYEIYKAFYSPYHLRRLGNWEWGNSLNKNSEFVVIQDLMRYKVMGTVAFNDDRFWRYESDSLLDFRPPVQVSDSRVLYLDDKLLNSINKFLGAESTKFGSGNIMAPSMPEGESEKRYNFLRQFIPILHGHWGGYWHLETHPVVQLMTFNRSLTQCKVYFRVGYQGGEALFTNGVTGWSMNKSTATWIE